MDDNITKLSDMMGDLRASMKAYRMALERMRWEKKKIKQFLWSLGYNGPMPWHSKARPKIVTLPKKSVAEIYDQRSVS